MAGIVNDADVGAHPSGREFNVLQIERPLLGAGRRRGRFGSIEHREVALQAQPVVPGPLLAPADQVGGAVEAVTHESDPRAATGPPPPGAPSGFRSHGPLRRLNPPRQRHRSLAKAQRQHQNLVAVGELGQDQNHGIAQRRRLFQNLARERLHDLVADDQGIAEKPRDPLVAHVRPVGARGNPAAKSIRFALRTSSIVATSSANFSRCVLRWLGSRRLRSALTLSAIRVMPSTTHVLGPLKAKSFNHTPTSAVNPRPVRN